MTSATPKPERIRTLYVSSENVDYFESSERITINLQDSVVPDDGYNLYYSLKSIGFNSTAMNISKAQKNNQLRYVITHDWSQVTHKIVAVTNPTELTIYTSGYKFEEILPADKIPKTTVDIKVPDGHYTLHSLFEYLTTSSVDPYVTPTRSVYVIPSGIYHDYKKVLQKDGTVLNPVENILPVPIQWSETPFGFQVEVLRLETEPFITEYSFTGTSSSMHINKLFPFISVISIEPSPQAPQLYNTLFTNYNSNYKNTPISTPSKSGINPPHAIDFHYTNIANMNNTPLAWNNMRIVERGNERNYDVPREIYPTLDKINYHNYVAYYKPVLDPVYVDVEISLPNPSMDERGHKNILTRIFTLGSKDGNSSLFQQWNNPKQVVISGNGGFSSLTLDFKAQAEKWNFFNLEFTIELEIFEMLEEYDYPDTHLVDVNIPGTDPISAVSALTPGHPTPLHPHHFNYQVAGLHTQKKTRYL